MSDTSKPKQKILIVDDVPENLHLLISILKAEYTVIAAVDGEKALVMAAISPLPDLILLDIQMPGMDGFEVLRQLKANSVTADIPVIFVTSLNEKTDEELGLSLGAVDYITKPPSPATTRLRVRNQLALKKAQLEILESEKMLSTIINAVQSAVVVIDHQGEIQFANPASEKMLGYEPKELIGKNLHQTVTPQSQREQANLGMEKFIQTGTGPVLDTPLELTALCKDGSEKFIELQVGRIRRHNQWWAVGAATDISHHKQLEIKLSDEAETDQLTGVKNRRSFMRLAENTLHDRSREDQQLFCMMLDLDHFKQINDIHGHATGDEVLRIFAKTCTENLRDNDLFARIGGEEFVALMYGKDLTAATNIAERIRTSFAKGTTITLDGKEELLETAVSIGLITVDQGSDDVESILKRSDSILYQAKSEGRNRVVTG